MWRACGCSRKVAFDAFYLIHRAARGLDDERELPHLLLHHGGIGVLRIGLYRNIYRRSEQPARSVVDECARLPCGWGCRLYGCHGAGDGDVLRGVADLGTIHAGGKEMVERGGRAVDGCRITARCPARNGSYRHGIACGSGQPLADAAPVGGQRNRAMVGMRCVVDRVFYITPCEGGCHKNGQDFKKGFRSHISMFFYFLLFPIVHTRLIPACVGPQNFFVLFDSSYTRTPSVMLKLSYSERV